MKKLEFKESQTTKATGLAGVNWTHRPSRIVTETGQTLHEMTDVEAPADWSDQAVNVVARQYLRKRLPDGKAETSVRALIHRVTSTIREYGESHLRLFQTAEDAQCFEKKLESILVLQQASFNSPVWFNCGLWHRYKVQGNAGNWAMDRKQTPPRAVPLENAFERPQSSACFIQRIDDDLNSIFELVKSEARLFKYGSGTGTNFSNLRSRFENLSGGGTSSGLMSFLEVFDRAAGATKSGGTTRRAAKMVCLDLDHPEILDFIRWKAKEEAKAQALIAAGFSAGMDGEAYRTVSGQNSNNSVRVTDEFMKSVRDDGTWSTKERRTGAVVETRPARELFRAISEAAWVCADPGVQYESAIQRWHTCSVSEPIRASNPCSEFMFLDNTACNLASLNLAKFVDIDGQFQIEKFRDAVRTLIVAQEILVDLASYPTREITERSHRFRPLGLGYANLGATLMSLGIPYDSDSGRDWAAAVTSLMSGEAYKVSGELAECTGAFDGFLENREPMLRVVRQHQEASSRLRGEVADAAMHSWNHALKIGSSCGFRNAQVSVLAPTGTIAFMMDCDTTGIEPDFALVKTKTLAGGGSLRIVNRTVARSLERLGYGKSDSVAVKTIVEKIEISGGGRSALRTAGIRDEHIPVFDCADEITPEAHLKMMAAVQPFLSGAISKTVNLPSSATVEDVEAVFRRGWELGLKAVAIYRDGSKSAQPLSRVSGKSVAQSSFLRNVNLCPECRYPSVLSGSCWVCPRCGHSIACS